MHKKLCLALFIAGLAAVVSLAADQNEKKDSQKPVVVMETSMGTIKIELFPDKAPKTVENFLQYVDEKFYDGLIFHRVMDGFMIQGGGLTPDMKAKPTRAPIANEARTDLRNDRGTIAMARTDQIHSATSQFFINVANNRTLNHYGNAPDTFGYAVFGRVIEGMDVVDKIRVVPTGIKGMHENVPLKPIVITSVRRAGANPPVVDQQKQ